MPERSHSAHDSRTTSTGSLPGPFKAHSQIVVYRQPAAVSLATERTSFSRFRSIFARQNSGRVEGHLKSGQSCPCQKHPCTKIAAFQRGNTRSGFPGSFRSWRRKRNPRACNPFRIINSGRVFVPRMPAIMRLRTSGETMSGIFGLRHTSICSANRFFDMRAHDIRHGLDDRHDNCVAKLAIRLRVRHRYPE